MDALLDALDRGWEAWERFWFESNAPVQMRLLRSSVGFLLFALYLLRTPDLGFLFSDSGLVPASVLKTAMAEPFEWSLLAQFPQTYVLWAAHAVLLLSLLALGLGIAVRPAAIVAFLLHVSFIHRNPAVAYGADTIATFFLFYLCFACYEAKDKAGPAASELGSVARRLCQVQLCVIYAYSGWGKLAGNHWWRGEAIWDVLANGQLARWDFSWAAAFPLALVGATYLTLLWEIYFPALVWLPRWRRPMLAIGVALHLGIGIALNIPFFAALMIAAYVPFLDEQTIRAAKGALTRASGR